jgi:hypothetical protein
MYIHTTNRLFAWECLEDSPSLRTVRQALEMLPDGKLLESLRWARGKGRDDYPVDVLWGSDRSRRRSNGASLPNTISAPSYVFPNNARRVCI